MNNSSTVPPQKILVLGAGELGIALIRQLAIQGVEASIAQVSVLLREASLQPDAPAKIALKQELDSLGVNIVVGDIANTSVPKLADIFRGFDSVVSCVGFAAGTGTQLKVTEAAIMSGGLRYFPWQFGVNYDVIGRGSAQPVFDEQLEVRELLRSQSSIEWVIVSTGMFTSFLFEPSFGVVDLANNTVNALGSWDTQVTVTTPEDIGNLTARLLLTTDDVANKIFYTAGDTLTYGHLAELVDSVLRKTVSKNEWSLSFLESELKKAPNDVVKRYRLVFAEGKGVAWDVKETFNVQQNIQVTTVKAWMQQNLF